MKCIVIIHLLLSFIILNQKAEACFFIPNPFCNNAFLRNNDVMLIAFIEQNQHSCKAVVLDVLKGNVTSDTINIYDYVAWCMEFYTNTMNTIPAQVGDTFLIILPKITAIESSWDTIGNYRFEDYMGGTNELRFSNDTLYGFVAGYASAPIEFNTYKISYQDFKSVWFDSSKNCNDLRTNIQEQMIYDEIKFFPNPVKNQLNIEISNTNTHQKYDAFIYDIHGKMVMKTSFSKAENTIELKQLYNGYYLIQLKQDNKLLLNRKFIKIN